MSPIANVLLMTYTYVCFVTIYESTVILSLSFFVLYSLVWLRWIRMATDHTHCRTLRRHTKCRANRTICRRVMEKQEVKLSLG